MGKRARLAAAAAAAAAIDADDERGDAGGHSSAAASSSSSSSSSAAAATKRGGAGGGGRRPRPDVAPPADGVVAHAWNEHRLDGSDERFRSGRWTPAEDARLLERYDEYCANHGLGAGERLAPITGAVKGTAHHDVWSFLAEVFTARTIRAVMRRAKRLLHPGNRQGGLSDEEQALLLQLVEQRGHRWDEIGRLMNRFPQSLATQHARLSATAAGAVNSGPWSAEEEDVLVAYIERYGTPLPGGGYGAIPWAVIGAEMRSRSPGQCLLKWNGGFGLRRAGLGWNAAADRSLVDAIRADGGETAVEVDWARLLPGRAGADARRRFDALCKRLQHHAALSFTKCVRLLRKDLAQAARAAAVAARRAGGKKAKKGKRGGGDDDDFDEDEDSAEVDGDGEDDDEGDSDDGAASSSRAAAGAGSKRKPAAKPAAKLASAAAPPAKKRKQQQAAESDGDDGGVAVSAASSSSSAAAPPAGGKQRKAPPPVAVAAAPKTKPVPVVVPKAAAAAPAAVANRKRAASSSSSDSSSSSSSSSSDDDEARRSSSSSSSSASSSSGSDSDSSSSGSDSSSSSDSSSDSDGSEDGGGSDSSDS